MSIDLTKKYGLLRAVCVVPDASTLGQGCHLSSVPVGEVVYESGHSLIYGPAISSVVEDAEGRLFVVCEDEPQASQINCCPFTGRVARVPVEQSPAWDVLHDAISHREAWLTILDEAVARTSDEADRAYLRHERRALRRLLDLLGGRTETTTDDLVREGESTPQETIA